MAEAIEQLAVYPTPSQEFCKRLREFDSSLQLNWDPAHGVWAIWCNDPVQGLSHVMNVVNSDGSYRPLDERVFQILNRNRHYAKNPKKLEKLICDEVISDRERQQKFVHDEMKHFAKDRALKRQFGNLVEEARSISWKEWQKECVLHDRDGKPLSIKYQPHHSLFEDGGKKPAV